MIKYLYLIIDIKSDVYDNMGKHSQIVIDMVQDTEQKLYRACEDGEVERDDLGAIGYQISILLEVFDPARIYDLEILRRLYIVIQKWIKDVDSFVKG